MRSREERWDCAFSRLASYVKENGHARVPSRYCCEGEGGDEQSKGYDLGNWVKRQRQQMKKDKLSKENIERLERLNFDWSISFGTNEEKWEYAYSELALFVEKNGHAQVPFIYYCKRKEDNDQTKDFHLGVWANNQRQQMKKKNLSSKRIERLKRLNFNWSLSVEINEESWEYAYSKLALFVEKRGHARVPSRYYCKRKLANDKTMRFHLGVWVKTQRAEKKSSRLSKERIEKLDALGFWVATVTNIDKSEEEGDKKDNSQYIKSTLHHTQKSNPGNNDEDKSKSDISPKLAKMKQGNADPVLRGSLFSLFRSQAELINQSTPLIEGKEKAKNISDDLRYGGIRGEKRKPKFKASQKGDVRCNKRVEALSRMTSNMFYLDTQVIDASLGKEHRSQFVSTASVQESEHVKGPKRKDHLDQDTRELTMLIRDLTNKQLYWCKNLEEQ